jgi:hypothetical protein
MDLYLAEHSLNIHTVIGLGLQYIYMLSNQFAPLAPPNHRATATLSPHKHNKPRRRDSLTSPGSPHNPPSRIQAAPIMHF